MTLTGGGPSGPSSAGALQLVANLCGAPQRLVDRLEGLESLDSDSTYCAFRVLAVAAQSPLAQAGLVPWFDFLVRCGGDCDLLVDASAAASDSETSDGTVTDAALEAEERMKRAVAASEGAPLRLCVYNCKNRSLREVVFTPHRRWGPGRRGADLTGARLALAELGDVLRHVARVLDVHPGSPALLAGLQPRSDYVLGTLAGESFRSADAVVAAVRGHMNGELHVLVYSSVADTVRQACVRPTSAWADEEGRGLLGCDIGMGQSHAIPADVRDSLGLSRPPTAETECDFAEVEGKARAPSSSTAHEQAVRHAVRHDVRHDVRTDLGFGAVCGESTAATCTPGADGPAKKVLVVELDWGLANGAVALQFIAAHRAERVPDLAALMCAQPASAL